MEEESKPFIFEKREVALIFICMVLIAFLSFSMGVKIGKKYTFTKEGFSKEDRKVLDLKSNLEEEIEANVNIESKEDLKSTKETINNFEKLESEFKKLDKEQIEIEKKEEVVAVEKPEKVETKIEIRPMAQLAGKYTILLGTFRSRADADTFADGFIVRGYEKETIIHEKELPHQGLMYRVSIGQFSTQKEASQYLVKEKSLFKGEFSTVIQFE